MGTGDVGVMGLLLSLLLVAVAIGLSRWRSLQLEGQIAWSVARAIVGLHH
jgi:ABC-type iron transport system FetAB permease component